jgi:group I intron endonuclease
MPRKQYTYHYIYKTTNLINMQYYIGMHSTFNIEDGYLGSGKKINYSIRKYGIENFKREILEFHLTREELIIAEIKIVNSDLIKDPLCMNLRTGGTCAPASNFGSKRSEETKLKMSLWERTDEYRKKLSKASKGKKKSTSHRENIARVQTGRKTSEETKLKMSKSAEGKLKSEETRLKMSKPKSEETRLKMSKPKSEETRLKMSEGVKNMKCPHCDLIARGNGMKRWHFDNCKFKK